MEALAMGMRKHGFNHPGWTHTDAALHGKVETITLEEVKNGEIEIQKGDNGEIQHKHTTYLHHQQHHMSTCSFTCIVIDSLVIEFGEGLSFVHSLIILSTIIFESYFYEEEEGEFFIPVKRSKQGR